jgi:AcrR family transcriptional regulator
MPRKADEGLEGRILEAAYDLWSKRGETALTMRAVARAAKTTTPTVYQRFRNKQDILEGIRRRAMENFLHALEPARSSVKTCERFLDFASSHPNDYRLLTADWAARLSRDERKPSFELITRLALGLGELLHGTATMLLAEGVHERVARELRDASITACEELIEHAAAKPGAKKATSNPAN